MSRPKPDFLLPLPADLEPRKFRCVTFMVPDDPEWYMSFWGWLYEMGYGKRWEKNTAHDGVIVAALWQKIFEDARINFLQRLCEPPDLTGGGIDQEDFMPLRVDCDCNVFVTCCDGTEKQILTGDQVQALINNQPGDGAPQPQPGGGCQTYRASFPANNKWLLPTVVSTGDTLTFNNLTGVTNDGGSLDWRCPDGNLFFAGACVGTTHFNGTDPMPTVPHMRVIANIDGTFYDVLPGPFTIPSGIANAQVYFQVNDSDITNNAGSIGFDVVACNNQATVFHHVFNFQIDAAGFAPTPQNEGPGCTAAGANFTGGTGWTPFPCSSINAAYINIGRSTPLTHVTHIEFAGELLSTPAGPSDFEVFLTYGGTEHLVATSAITAAGPIGVSQDGPWDITAIRVRIGLQPDTADFNVSSFTVDGTGSDPF